MNELYDPESGSIKIPMYEWELMNNTPLKKLWSLTINGNLSYCLRDNNSYLLRGSKTYYYFLANRQKINGKDFTTYDNVIEWYENYTIFFESAKTAISQTSTLNSISDKKLILGILDNSRNYLLVQLNQSIYNKYEKENILYKLNSRNSNNINEIYNVLSSTIDLMKKITFEENYKISKSELFYLLDRISSILLISKNDFFEREETKDYSKEFRTYREIDNFAENFTTIKMCEEKNPIIVNQSVCGMSYGGIELPIIYKSINSNIKDVLILKFNKNVSGYSNKQLVQLRRFNINKYGGLITNDKITNNDLILLDDNVLTGKTLQLAINSLYDMNFNTNRISIVRFPGINRTDQMFFKNHGAVDFNLFFDYITGLCYPSPYSWRDENNFDQYLDSLGVFDLNRKKITECLIKNHDYRTNSEVYNYQRRLTK